MERDGSSKEGVFWSLKFKERVAASGLESFSATLQAVDVLPKFSLAHPHRLR